MLGFDRVGLQVISYTGAVIIRLKILSHIRKAALLATYFC